MGLCAAAYGFLSAYALKVMHAEQLEVHQEHLRALRRQNQELLRKSALLEQAAQFTQRAKALGLERSRWAFYDVNFQAPLEFEAAQQIVSQCGDSSLAYFWPISLEIKAPVAQQPAGAPPAGGVSEPADVQVAVKGRFVARQ